MRVGRIVENQQVDGLGWKISELVLQPKLEQGTLELSGRDTAKLRNIEEAILVEGRIVVRGGQDFLDRLRNGDECRHPAGEYSHDGSSRVPASKLTSDGGVSQSLELWAKGLGSLDRQVVREETSSVGRSHGGTTGIQISYV